jgi:hypothetical protein
MRFQVSQVPSLGWENVCKVGWEASLGGGTESGRGSDALIVPRLRQVAVLARRREGRFVRKFAQQEVAGLRRVLLEVE